MSSRRPTIIAKCDVEDLSQSSGSIAVGRVRDVRCAGPEVFIGLTISQSLVAEEIEVDGGN